MIIIVVFLQRFVITKLCDKRFGIDEKAAIKRGQTKTRSQYAEREQVRQNQ